MSLRFSKNKTVYENYKLLEQFIVKFDNSFGNILMKNLNEPLDAIREKVKKDVSDIINE